MDARQFSGYDLIGDVHGCYDALVELLHKLGYHKQQGRYVSADPRRPRQLLFLGDLLDRGPGIRESVQLVYELVEQGQAQIVMGNHEYDALAWNTPAPPGTGRSHLREHNRHNSRIIQQTLEQFANHPSDWRDLMAWLERMPLVLELAHFRVVHACWDQRLIDELRSRYPDARMNRELLMASADKHQFAGRLIDRLTRGVDLVLPDGMQMRSRDGLTRQRFRAKYWVSRPANYGDLEFQPDPLPDDVAQRPVSEADRAALPYYSLDAPLLFVGHYWQSGKPRRLRRNMACLDYSAVKAGRLVAYRLDDESELDNEKFVWVDGIK
ncbi:MAG TPA: metallophosphoesterase, partial [Spongiibacteraceae bacterium]|nr:metallophosphoesterase [Spongiibacteraceae bacterium]